MLRETNTSTTEVPGGDLLEIAEDLASARRALEAIEARAFAGVTEVLAGAIDRATEAIERLEAMSPD